MFGGCQGTRRRRNSPGGLVGFLLTVGGPGAKLLALFLTQGVRAGLAYFLPSGRRPLGRPLARVVGRADPSVRQTTLPTSRMVVECPLLRCPHSPLTWVPRGVLGCNMAG